MQVLWALQNVSLRVDEGDSLGIIGVNGAGKSTLLRCLAGIIEPTSGRIQTFGRLAALLELGAGFNPNLTGVENVFLYCSLHGVGRREVQKKMTGIIDFSGLGNFIDVPVKNYSTGMYLRLAFAAAVHLDPDVLLIDEIIAVGDTAFQERCLERMQRFRSEGKAIVLVTHNLQALERFCDRALLLDGGRVVMEDFPAKVINSYLDRLATSGSGGIVSALADTQSQDQDKPPELVPEVLQGPGAAPSPGDRLGSREIEITAVRVIDERGRTTAQLESGGGSTIQICYRVHRPVEWPVFVIVIYDTEGRRLADSNTHVAGLELNGLGSAGTVEYRLPALPLLPGEYVLTTAVYRLGSEEPVDHLERTHGFQVTPGAKRGQQGQLYVPAQWVCRVEP